MNKILAKIYAMLDELPFLKGSKEAPMYFLVIVVGFFLSLFSIYIFSEIAENIFFENTLAIDKSIIYAIYSIRTPLLTTIMMWCSFMGAELTIFLGSIGILFLALYHRWKEAFVYGVIFAMGVLLNQILKIFYQRPRPDMDPLIALSSFSFPSGHSMNSFIFYMLLSYYMYRLYPQKHVYIPVFLICCIIILMVGFSRVYLGVHYPTDVLAGYVAGFFVVATAILLKRVNMFFTLENKKKK